MVSGARWPTTQVETGGSQELAAPRLWGRGKALPFLKIMQTLLSSVQPLQVLHHLLHVLLGVTVLDIGKPAAAHTNDNRHHQHEVLEVIMACHCQKGSAW